MPNTARQGSPAFRCGMGLFILFTLLTNLYVILMFHQMTGREKDVITSAGLRAFGIEPPIRHHEIDEASKEEGDDSDDASSQMNNKSAKGLQARIKLLQEQLANEEKQHESDINDLNEKLVRQQEKAGAQLEEAYRSNAQLKEQLQLLKDNASAMSDGGNENTELQQDSMNEDSSNKDPLKSREVAEESTEQLESLLDDKNSNNDNINDEEKQQQKLSLRKRRQEKRQEQGHQKQKQHDDEYTLVWPLPKNWEDMGFHDVRDHFKCKAHAHDQTKPLPSLDDWQFLRDQYKKVVDENANFDDDPVPPTDGYTLNKETGEVAQFHAAKSMDGRGRGLFASRDIQKGELVLDGNQSDFIFPSGMAWRRYVLSLPRKKACDVIDWTWTQKTKENGPFHIFSAMNISVLLNGGYEDEYNVMPPSEISSMMYATKDIKKDEELLTDYYIYDTVWEEVGL